MMKIVLITHWYFSHCWAVLTQHQDLFCFSVFPTSKQTGSAQEVERRHNWDSWTQMKKGYYIPYNLMLSDKKWEGKLDRVAFAQGVAGHLLAGGEQLRGFVSLLFLVDWLVYLGLFLDFCFFGWLVHWLVGFYPIKLSLSQFTWFFTFPLPVLSPISFQGSEWAAVRCLAACWG